MARTAHSGQDGKDAGAATHIQHFEVRHVVIENAAEHLRGRGMMARAERHTRVDGDAILRLGHVVVERACHHTALADNERLEIVLLPLLVPVAVVRLRLLVGNGGIGQGEIG